MNPEELKNLKRLLKGWCFDPIKKSIDPLTKSTQFVSFDRIALLIHRGYEPNASPGSLIFSYAAARQHDEVIQRLNALKGSAEYAEAINFAAQGYAAVCHDPMISEDQKREDQKILDQKIEEYCALGADPTAIAIGYVLSQNEAKVAEYQTKPNTDLISIALAYALCEKYSKAKVEQYFKDNNVEEHWLALVDGLLGHSIDLKEYADKPKSLALIAFGSGLMKGSASGTKRFMIDDFKDQEAKNAFLQGQILAGLSAKIESDDELESYFFHGGSYKAAADAFSVEEDQENLKKYDMKTIALDYLKMRTEEREYPGGPTKQYHHYSPFGFFQKSYKQKSLAVGSLVDALNEKPGVDLISHLSTLQDGRLGKQLREFIKAGKANELVGKEVTTVKEFVNALQEKVSLKSPSKTS